MDTKKCLSVMSKKEKRVQICWKGGGEGEERQVSQERFGVLAELMKCLQVRGKKEELY